MKEYDNVEGNPISISYDVVEKQKLIRFVNVHEKTFLSVEKILWDSFPSEVRDMLIEYSIKMYG